MRAAGNRATDYLLIDISNSYTKLAFATRRKIAKTIRHPTNQFTAAFLRRTLRGRSVGTIVVSSVVPRKNKAIAMAAGLARVLFLSPKLDLGVGVDSGARSIGADRLANARLWLSSMVTRRCRSIRDSVTFDVVSGARRLRRRVIAPGLEAMTSFLYQRTALLPKLTLREPKRALKKPLATQ